MRKFFLTLAVLVMAICANAQKNQYFWYQGNLMFGNPMAQIDSLTFGEEDTDSILIYLPRTVIKTVHDTIYITIHDTVCPGDCLEGALKGEFSVSATKKVNFSRGNLQYQASTQSWRFAENQYDMIGDGNAKISASYSGWIDLLGWGTGNNPTLSSEDASDYSTYVEWGENSISNGAHQANLWRTLTKDEWVYLFFTRTDAAILFGLGSVNGVNGTILLPDNWVTPEGASFTPSTSKGMSYKSGYYNNSKGDNFSHNSYTAEQWVTMEEAGAVFLPAAGYRMGKGLEGVGSSGRYWASTPYNDGSAYNLYFNVSHLDAKSFSDRSNGRSVRLVHETK